MPHMWKMIKLSFLRMHVEVCRESEQLYDKEMRYIDYFNHINMLWSLCIVTVM